MSSKSRSRSGVISDERRPNQPSPAVDVDDAAGSALFFLGPFLKEPCEAMKEDDDEEESIMRAWC